MTDLDSLLKSSRPESTPRSGTSARIMRAVSARPSKRTWWMLRPVGVGIAGSALMAGAALGFVDLRQHPAGLTAQVAHRLGIATGKAEIAEVRMPAAVAALSLPECTTGTVPCQIKTATGVAAVAVTSTELADPKAMDKLGRTLSAETASSHDSVKVYLYSSLVSAQSGSPEGYVGQFERHTAARGGLGGALIRYVPAPGAVPQTITYEAAKPAPNSARAVALAKKDVNYVGGKVTKLSGTSLTLHDAKGDHVITLTDKTHYVTSGNIAESRRNITLGDILYLLERDHTAIEVIDDAGVVDAAGAVEYDFYGIDLASVEDAIIAN